MNFNMMFADNLRKVRECAGITQTDLAQRIGMTASCVSMYETGRRLPNLLTTSMIAFTLGVSVDDLVPIVEPDVRVDDPGQTVIFDLIGE